jgi:hypothetical protein
MAPGAAGGAAEDFAVGGVEDPGDGVDGRAGGELGEFGVDVRGGRQRVVAHGLGDDREGNAAGQREADGEVA